MFRWHKWKNLQRWDSTSCTKYWSNMRNLLLFPKMLAVKSYSI